MLAILYHIKAKTKTEVTKQQGAEAKRVVREINSRLEETA
jgi:hypothetical protein